MFLDGYFYFFILSMMEELFFCVCHGLEFFSIFCYILFSFPDLILLWTLGFRGSYFKIG